MKSVSLLSPFSHAIIIAMHTIYIYGPIGEMPSKTPLCSLCISPVRRHKKSISWRRLPSHVRIHIRRMSTHSDAILSV